MTELQILTAIDNNGGRMKFVELMNLGKTDQNWMPNADHQRICQLIDAKVLSGKPSAFGTISFGPNGHLRLWDLQQASDNLSKQMADNQSEKNADRRFQLFNTLLGAVIGAAITLLTQWFISLF